MIPSRGAVPEDEVPTTTLRPHALDDTLGGTAPGLGGVAPEVAPGAGRVIGGRYRIVRQIGAGAMG